MPGLRWEAEGYGPVPDRWIQSGAAGLIVFGGAADAACAEIARVRALVDRGLIFGADLERGAGQQFAGATPLPPAAAFGALDRTEVTKAAAALTTREARAIGVDVVFAPLADIASEIDNPIVGPRAFSANPECVSRHAAAWVAGARESGAWSCAKHFPGHGRTTGDSHVGGVSIAADQSTVEADWEPFAATIAEGVPMVMTAHVSVPSLDPSGRPATRSKPILQGGLREKLGFSGLIVTDALLMAGAGEAAQAAVEAIEAGVDLLLYPEDPDVVATALAEAAEADPGFRAALERASRRVRGAAEQIREARSGGAEVDTLVANAATPGVNAVPPAAEALPPEDKHPGWGLDEDRDQAMRWAAASIRAPGTGDPPLEEGARVHLTDIDDDLGGPFPPPSRAPFRDQLARTVHLVDADSADHRVIAVWADTRGWKGRAGLSVASMAAVREALSKGLPTEAGGATAPSTHVVVFGGLRPAMDLPAGTAHWLAWGGEELMQRAAADRLTGRSA